jgi:hypothetical protein
MKDDVTAGCVVMYTPEGNASGAPYMVLRRLGDALYIKPLHVVLRDAVGALCVPVTACRAARLMRVSTKPELKLSRTQVQELRKAAEFALDKGELDFTQVATLDNAVAELQRYVVERWKD